MLRFWRKVTHHALQQTNVLSYWYDWFISTLWLLSSEPENEESETQRELWLRFRTTSQIASLSTLSEGEVMFLSKYASGYLVKFGQKWWKGKVFHYKKKSAKYFSCDIYECSGIGGSIRSVPYHGEGFGLSLCFCTSKLWNSQPNCDCQKVSFWNNSYFWSTKMILESFSTWLISKFPFNWGTFSWGKTALL